MSQCYQLFISPVLGIVSIKQDLRQALLNPHSIDTHLPWDGCGQSLWGGAGPHPENGETSTDQCSLAHLKLPAGTKTFHINWMSPNAQSLSNLQKVASTSADLKAECLVRLLVRWWAVTGSGDSCFVWCVLPAVAGKLRFHPQLPTGAWWSSEEWHFLCSSRLSCHRLNWTEYLAVKEEVGLISIGCLGPQAAAGFFTQFLTYNKSSYEHNGFSWTHNIVVFHFWQLVVILNFVKIVGYFNKVNKAIWNECSKRKTLLFLLKP